MCIYAYNSIVQYIKSYRIIVRDVSLVLSLSLSVYIYIYIQTCICIIGTVYRSIPSIMLCYSM